MKVDQAGQDKEPASVDFPVGIAGKAGTHVYDAVIGKGEIGVAEIGVPARRPVPRDKPGGVPDQRRGHVASDLLSQDVSTWPISPAFGGPVFAMPCPSLTTELPKRYASPFRQGRCAREREVGADRNVKPPQRGLAGCIGDVGLSRGSGEARHNHGHGKTSESHDGFPEKSNDEPDTDNATDLQRRLSMWFRTGVIDPSGVAGPVPP